MGAGHQKDQSMVTSLEYSAPTSVLWKGTRGLEIKAVIRQGYVTSPPYHISTTGFGQLLDCCAASPCPGSGSPCENRNSYLRTLWTVYPFN